MSGAERSKTRDLDGVASRLDDFFAQAANHEVQNNKTMVCGKETDWLKVVEILDIQCKVICLNTVVGKKILEHFFLIHQRWYSLFHHRFPALEIPFPLRAKTKV